MDPRRFAFAAIAFSTIGVMPAGSAPSARAAGDEMPLLGEWRFILDPRDVGEREKWATGVLPDIIKLPGSTAENGFGDEISVDTKWTGRIVDRSWFTEKRYEKYRQPGNVKVPFWLSPVKHYVGSAWYQKDVEIPSDWRGRRITLLLERCHWTTRVWVDGQDAGTANSLCVPHEYDLTRLMTPGEHRLAIRVDNRLSVNVGENAHSVSDHTQTNWNGIVGRIVLRAESPVFVDDVQVYPDVANKKAKVVVTVGNRTGERAAGVLTLRAIGSLPNSSHEIPSKQLPFTCDKEAATIEVEYPMGDDVRLWDEFTPNVYTLTARIESDGRIDEKGVDFGMREIGVEGTQFTINGRKRFVRGTLECCIFPMTGYPPTDVESWMRMLKIARAHGLNQLRFHSWCPPEAAFIAGDRMGFMHQVECDVWTTVGEDPKTDAFIRDESDRILRAYGNHPSFCFLAHGNEPAGKNQKRFLGDLVNYWKGKDRRRLYTSGAGWPSIPENDYHVTPEPRIQHWGAGLQSRINARPPETETDYHEFIGRFKVPVVSHEIGQWCVYPDFNEIARYTGVLRARNFEIFRDGLAASGMLDQAHDFLIASGKLQTLCYKEDIESALRTPGFGGFQLLDLHDFPGQGTALVGVLNAFWGSKGYVTPEEYHRFACETVPLARMSKRVWTSDETFKAALEIAHFGAGPIENARVAWAITDGNGKKAAGAELPARDIPLGNGTTLGEVITPLADVAVPAKLVLTVSIVDTPYGNNWDFWVYSPKVNTDAPKDVLIVDKLDDKAVAALRSGGKVMLIPAPGTVSGDEHGVVPPGFSSIFWNTAWTARQAPHTLGILCDPANPALQAFPTEFHSNWQWWDLISKSQIMILNGLPADLRPIVQVIDDWFTNRRLGLVFEAKVGGGKLLVCGIDLINDLDKRPVARQMRSSLLAYMASDRFAPSVAVDVEAVRRLTGRIGLEVVKVDSEAKRFEGWKAADGGPSTVWHTPWEGKVPGYPHEIQLKLSRQIPIEGLRYLPRQDLANGRISEYEVYVSDDPAHWGEPAAKGTFTNDPEAKEILFKGPVNGRFIRFVAMKGFDGQPYAAIAELSVIPASE